MGQKLSMELRGSMNRFEPLTEAAFPPGPENGLTLEELEKTLKTCGLSLEYVVHDPGRIFANTFYADFAHGLYIPFYLNQQYIIHNLIRVRVERQQSNAQEALASGDWIRFYRLFVPEPMLIYDFQRRYQDIPAEHLFSVWHSIHKRINYANGMWRPEVLEAVFSKASPAKLPPLDADGRITLYRGMRKLSQPPEQAISWSAHPGNALWSAIHSGFGTKLAVARVRPEDIVAYDEGCQQENEVILRPGTEMELFYEDMIPATEEMVVPLFSSTILDFVKFGRQAPKLGYPVETLLRIHGVNHILRVLFLPLLYFHNAGDLLTEADKQILIYFSLLHDIRRTSEDRDLSHGAKSVELIRKKGIRLQGVRLSKKDYRIAELLIRCHCLDDQRAFLKSMPCRGCLFGRRNGPVSSTQSARTWTAWITGCCGRTMPAVCR